MKTILNSNPEFSLTYNHCGVSVTVSGKILLEEYLSTARSDQDNEQHLGLVLQDALPESSSLAAQLLTQFHLEFYRVLAVSQAKQNFSLHTSNSGINNPADSTSDTDTDPFEKKEV